jgi:phenylacetate-CoA ligase
VAESAGPAILARSMHFAYGGLRYPRLHRAQWLSLDELRDLQWRRLEGMLRHAYARSPLYRERFLQAGITPADIRSIDDLRLLPVTTREDLRQPEALIAEGYTRHRLRSSMTSGSTGRRTTSYFDESAWVLAKNLLKLRARQACGVRPWDRIALFQEDAPDETVVWRGARRRAFTIHRPIEEILPAVRAFAPTVLYGFAGYFARLARAPGNGVRPRMVFTSGELLDPTTRSTIETGLAAPVLDVYGCTEVKEIAWQCPAREGYHVNADWLVVEVESDDPAGGSQGGRLLVTSLYNFAMPLLRYDVGDAGFALAGRCPCGRGLPLILPTLGRSVDHVALANGKLVPPYSLTCAVEAIEGMHQYQFVQTRADVVELRVVPNDDFGDASRQALLAALRPVLPGVTIHVRTVPSIPSEPSGKYRIVKSEVATANGSMGLELQREPIGGSATRGGY